MCSIKQGALIRYGIAIVAGILLGLSFAPVEWAGAAWAGPGLMLFSSLGVTGGRAFRLGFVAGLAEFLSSLSWLLAIPFRWHGIPLAPGAGWLALSLYCAVYSGLWVWLCWKFFPGAVNNREQFLSTPMRKRIGWALGAAALWTGLEIVRGCFLSGFPWNFLGVSQYRLLPVIQIAAVTGVFGVSFLVVWCSVGIASALLKLTWQKVWWDALPPLLALGLIVSSGTSRLMRPISTLGHSVKMALIQPSIPQTLIWTKPIPQSVFKK